MSQLLRETVANIQKFATENPISHNLMVLNSYEQESRIIRLQSLINNATATPEVIERAKKCITALDDIMMFQIETTYDMLIKSSNDTQQKIEFPKAKDKEIKLIPKAEKSVDTKVKTDEEKKAELGFERYKVLNELTNPKERNQSLFDIKTLNECTSLPLLEMELRKYKDHVKMDVIRNLYMDFIEAGTYTSDKVIALDATEEEKKSFDKENSELSRLKVNPIAQAKRFSATVENYKAKVAVIKRSDRIKYSDFLTNAKKMYESVPEQGIKYVIDHLRKSNATPIDENDKIMNTFSEIATVKWIKENLDPNYVLLVSKVPEVKTDSEILTTTSETKVEEKKIILDVIEDIDFPTFQLKLIAMISENKLLEAHAFGVKVAVENGFKQASGDINRWGLDTFENYFEGIKKDTLAGVIIGEEISTAELEEIESKGLDIVRNARKLGGKGAIEFNKLCKDTYKLSKLTMVALYRKISNKLEAETKKESIVLGPAPLFIREKASVLNPELFKQYGECSDLTALDYAVRMSNNATDRVFALNLALDLAPTIEKSKAWTTAEIEKWVDEVIENGKKATEPIAKNLEKEAITKEKEVAKEVIDVIKPDAKTFETEKSTEPVKTKDAENNEIIMIPVKFSNEDDLRDFFIKSYNLNSIETAKEAVYQYFESRKKSTKDAEDKITRFTKLAKKHAFQNRK